MNERSTETFGDERQQPLAPQVRALGLLLSELSILSFSTFMDAAETAPQDEATVLDALERMGCLTIFQSERIRRNSAAELRFDEYILLDKLGEGGMGAVFKARNLRLDRIEAIKTIRAAEGHSEALARRFEREAKVLAKLEHPAIVPIYKVGRFQNTDYLAMKYVTGETLKSRVERARHACEHISFPIACQWMIDSADALGHAHEHNVIHRDIKPSNIMRQEKGRVIVLDMGIARLADPDAEQSGPSLTMQQRGLGTPEYMPPEQWADARAVVPASDLYALGCTFFYVLTGRTPFTGNRLLDLMKAHSKEPPPSLLDFRKDVPEQLDAVIQKLLAKKPEDRFESAQELIDSIRGFAAPAIVGSPTALSETVGDANSAMPTPPMPTPTMTNSKSKSVIQAEPKKGTSLAPAIVATSLILASGIGYVFYKSSQKTDSQLQSQDDKSKQSSENEKAIAPKIDFAAEAGKLFDEAIQTNGQLLKSRKDLESSLASAGISTVAASAPDLERIRQAIDKLLVDRKKLASVPAIPEWIVQFQKANPIDWQSVEDLVVEIRSLTGATGNLTSDSESKARKPIEAITQARRDNRLGNLLDQWISAYREQHTEAWPDQRELRSTVEALLPKKKLESEQQLEALKKPLDEVSEQVINPFAKLKIAANDEWTNQAINGIKAVIGTHPIIKTNGYDLQAKFLDGKNQTVTKVKVGESAWISVTPSKDSCFAIFPLDAEEMFIILFNTKISAKSELVIEPAFRFPSPGKRRFVIYAVDHPIINEILPPNASASLSKTFASKNALNRAFHAMETGAEIPSVPLNKTVTSAARTIVELDVVEK